MLPKDGSRPECPEELEECGRLMIGMTGMMGATYTPELHAQCAWIVIVAPLPRHNARLRHRCAPDRRLAADPTAAMHGTLARNT